MNSKYDQYESGGADYEQNPELIFTTYATVSAELNAVFGNQNQYGQSLGLAWEALNIEDGVLYADPEKQKYKLFSWQEANDLSPAEQVERGNDPSADDASEVITKTYGGTTKTYELVGARVEELTDNDGEAVVEASSKVRDFEFVGEEDFETGDFEDLGGDVIEAGDFVSWYGAQEETGASISSQVIAETTTEYGETAVVDEDDYQNWLVDTTGDNILREDLEGRRVRFFVVRKPGENHNYNLPIFEGADTGAQIKPDNRGADTGNSDGGSIGDSEAVQEAAELDQESYPEPIADFISSGNRLDLTEERAQNLLDQLINDDDNGLTSEMITDHGGRQVLVNQVI